MNPITDHIFIGCLLLFLISSTLPTVKKGSLFLLDYGEKAGRLPPHKGLTCAPHQIPSPVTPTVIRERFCGGLEHSATGAKRLIITEQGYYFHLNHGFTSQVKSCASMVLIEGGNTSPPL